jgi:hypothetical protein
MKFVTTTTTTTMASAGLIWREHKPNGGIQWLHMKPLNVTRVVSTLRHGRQICC